MASWRVVTVGVTLAGATLASAVGIGAIQLAQDPISYDVFCALPGVAEKRAAFVATTAENRARIVRTQLERWRAMHRERLSSDQLALLAEILSIVTPESYAGGAETDEARERARALAARQRELFTRDDMQAMQPNGPCLPPVKKSRP